MRIVKTNSIEFTPGEYAITNGHSGSERDHYNKYTGRYVSQRSYGWASECRPSRLTVEIELEGGETFDVWVDRFFKDNWGRLTSKRVNAICRTLPEKLLVEEHEARSGGIYFTVDERLMKAWLEVAKTCA